MTELRTAGAGRRTLERPLLAPWYRAVRDGDRLLFEHAGEVVELRGQAVEALLPALLPLLDGSHTVTEIVEQLGEGAEPPVLKALDALRSHGLLTEGPAVAADAVAPTYVAAVCPGATLSSSLERLAASLAVVVGSSRCARQIGELLVRSGVRVRYGSFAPETRGADIVVAAPDTDEVAQLRALNDRRLRDGGPWLAVLPNDGRFVGVGPLHLPGQTACHVCYLSRRASTSGYEAEFAAVEEQPVAAPTPDAIGAIAAGLAALICVRWLAAADPTLPGVLWSFETSGLPVLERHRVLRVPRCPACGVPAPAPNPWFKALDA